ncbi:hypothetical protein OKW28_003695 [Paraburkholderia sp. 40]
MGIDRAFPSIGLFHPDIFENCVPGKYLPRMRQKKTQEFESCRRQSDSNFSVPAPYEYSMRRERHGDPKGAQRIFGLHDWARARCSCAKVCI